MEHFQGEPQGFELDTADLSACDVRRYLSDVLDATCLSALQRGIDRNLYMPSKIVLRVLYMLVWVGLQVGLCKAVKMTAHPEHHTPSVSGLISFVSIKKVGQ